MGTAGATILGDDWLTTFNAPIVLYNEDHPGGDVPVEGSLSGGAMPTAVQWVRSGDKTEREAV